MAWPETVRKGDLRIDFYRGSGPGGQHRNKTDSACRITHIPTGLTAQSENQKSQARNRAIAFKRLAAKLVPIMRQAHRMAPKVRTTERVRTYHEPRGTVKDHRLGKSYNYDTILGGGLDELLADLLHRPNPEK